MYHSATRCHHAPPPAAGVALALLVALGSGPAGCRPAEPAPPQEPGGDGLTAHLSAVLRAVATRPDRAAQLVARWKLTPEELAERLTPGYRDLHARYAASFDAHAPELARSLPALADRAGATWRVIARVHYADDPYITPEMVRLRWALPTARPGHVAFVVPDRAEDQARAPDDAALAAGADPARIDAVFVHTGTRWRALIGFGDAVARLVRERAGDACFARLDLSCRSGRCSHETYQLFKAAVVGGDIARACAGLSRR